MDNLGIRKFFLFPPPPPPNPQKRGGFWIFEPLVLLLKHFSAIKRVVKKSKILPFVEDLGGTKKKSISLINFLPP